LDDINPNRVFAVSTKATNYYADVKYQLNDALLFGSETSGLPDNLRNQFTGIRIPMQPNSRSLNLANSVAIVLFEALRQTSFTNLT